MIREIRLRNFAIIEALDAEFGPGLNVLSGETGAGKSIIVGALCIALGQRAYAEMIKTGASEATVEVFLDDKDHPLLGEMGIDGGEGIIIKRVVSATGKSRAYVNGSMLNLQRLAALGETLVDIHGQHEHQSLLAQDNQLMLLDSYGKCGALRDEVAEKFAQCEALRKKLNSVREGAKAAAERLDLLRFQTGEIEAASLEPGEDETLEEESAVLANQGRLKELIEQAYGLVYGQEGSASEKLSSSVQALKEMAGFDKGVQDTLDVLAQAMDITEDISHSLRTRKDMYEADPARLQAVQERLDQITGLKKKYGPTLSGVLAFAEASRAELESAATSGESARELEAALAEMDSELMGLAVRLSAKRKKAAGPLKDIIVNVLGELALAKARFEVAVGEAPVSATGADIVEFLFSANPGEALKPLTKVASGGELSRIMLAVKSVLRRDDDIPVLVFDEVDAGIGGKTAHNVARKLKETSVGRQVLCVTHLPQIASAADRHMLIEKHSTGGSTSVSMRVLREQDRREEVARMLGGKVTDTSLKHAGEMLKSASK